jgi:hypothetical protein
VSDRRIGVAVLADVTDEAEGVRVHSCIVEESAIAHFNKVLRERSPSVRDSPPTPGLETKLYSALHEDVLPQR